MPFGTSPLNDRPTLHPLTGGAAAGRVHREHGPGETPLNRFFVVITFTGELESFTHYIYTPSHTTVQDSPLNLPTLSATFRPPRPQIAQDTMI